MNLSFSFRPLRWLLLLALSLVIVLCVLCAVLQSKWAREEIRKALLSALDQAGITADLSEVQGILPFSWNLETAELSLSNGDRIALHQVTLRLAILPLLKGKVDVNYLHIDEGRYLPSSPLHPFTLPSLEEFKEEVRAYLDAFHLPFALKLSHLSVDQFQLIHPLTLEEFAVGLTGEAKLKQNKEEFSLKLHLFSPDSHQTYLETTCYGNEPKDLIEASLYIHLDNIPPFFPLQGTLSSSLQLSGSWITADAFLHDHKQDSEPLLLKVTGTCLHARMDAFPSLNTDWNFDSVFLLSAAGPIKLKTLHLKSTPLELLAAGVLQSPLDLSHLTLSFRLPDLTLWPTPLPLSGSVQGKILYTEGHFTTSFKTDALHVASFEANTVTGKLEGEIDSHSFSADTSLSSSDAVVPFTHHTLLSWTPERLSLDSFEWVSGSDFIKGSLSYAFEQHLCTGTLAAQVQECRRFESLFPSQHFHGRLSSEITLLQEGGSQAVSASLICDQAGFQNILVDSLFLSCTIKDPFHSPEGKVHLLAEKLYAKGQYVEKLLLDTQSCQDKPWPYSLHVEGRIETPFFCNAQGEWQKTDHNWNLTLSELRGTLLNMPFFLKYPTFLSKEPTSFTIAPLEIQVGKGLLYTSAEFSSQLTQSHVEISHFPLEVLRCFYPRFGLKGFLSARGSLEGDTTTLQGSLNAVLEEASLTHFDNRAPFQSKGSLQAHLYQDQLQLHADLEASDAQFLDFSATLPVQHTCYPFSLSLNPKKNTSAELIAEGKLEDLFDFVNPGTNHFTGLVSCRLFLSQTLLNPSLLGQIHWQEGSYENDFTGITLKGIQAQFEAEHAQLRLTQLTAQDEESGLVSAQGVIELKPHEHFPYHFNAELQHLHALRFDMIDCHISGPFYLSGDTREMLAQGNLLVDKAKIQITEHLPYEPRSLPFTYLNKPHLLDLDESLPRPAFPFHLDLELTATDKVKVEGRGLNAELEGDIHLHGTNTNIAANGQLNLVKGEYLFSGKIFRLTEGNLSFNDKPTPSSYLNVTGTLSLPEATITARMHGPLTSPILTFHSNPHKSTSSILALVLFNKDISEINHMEAVQLASTLITLSGGAGPNVLESIRKTLGVDRLNLSSGPESGSIAIQVGKYLMQGVMITLSQSTTSSQILVEVELPRGFVFQAETQEEDHKEGKFSLKWRKSY